MYRIAVTNRYLCDNIERQVEKIAAEESVDRIILREKDLDEKEYRKLAGNIIKICDRYNKECVLHNFYNAAIELYCEKIHLPLQVLLSLSDSDKSRFSLIGVSVHSCSEAVEAQRAGASYVIAGHIFATECKKNVKPRGIELIEEICARVSIPVYGIGGITPENEELVIAAGGAGVCSMSYYMKK